MTDMYFQFNTETNDFIQAFEKPKKFQCLVGGDLVTRGKDFFSHTQAEMLKSGIKVGTLIKPELTYGKKHGAPVDDSVNLTRTYPLVDVANLAEKEANERTKWKDNIDRLAANVRKQYAGYDLIDEEYDHAYKQAVAFKDGGYTGTVPPSVQSWLDASPDMTTATESADNIIATGNGYFLVLETVRDLRLKGKAAIDAALGSAIESTGQAEMAKLEALINV